MKTHMNNTTALTMKNDILGHTMFSKHQFTLHSGAVKPIVVTKHKQQVKIIKNNKVQLNTNPNQHVNHLFNNLHNKTKTNVKSTIDNKIPETYKLKQTLLKNKIKNNKLQKHQLTEHQRQWKQLQNRIQNCKSLQQRKKDKTDPITNPVYLIKSGDKVSDLTIDPYCQKILNMNRPKSAVLVGSRNTNIFHLTNNSHVRNVQQQFKQSYLGAPVVDLSKTSKSSNGKVRPSTAKVVNEQNRAKHVQDLPEPTYKGILNYLLSNKVYKDNEIKVLYVRLCYAYGQDHIDDIWQQVMDHLQS